MGKEAFVSWSSSDSLYGSRQLASAWATQDYQYSGSEWCQEKNYFAKKLKEHQNCLLRFHIHLNLNLQQNIHVCARRPPLKRSTESTPFYSLTSLEPLVPSLEDIQLSTQKFMILPQLSKRL